jgi:hypothetical protein
MAAKPNASQAFVCILLVALPLAAAAVWIVYVITAHLIG